MIDVTLNYPDGMTRSDWIHVGELTDPVQTACDKLEGFFEKEGFAPETIVDIERALRRLGFLVDRETGDVKLSRRDLEEVLEHMVEYFDGYFDDTEVAA